jgi:cation:H+ antiporter
MELTHFNAMFLAIGGLALGIVMLVRGGNWTIDASVFLAREYGISHLLIGFTIIAFGTSLPELIVSLNANMKDAAGIVIGNVVGSNISNILMVIGLTATMTTLYVLPRDIYRDVIMMLLTSFLLAGLLLWGAISSMSGLAMVAGLVVYVFWQYRLALRGEIEVEEVEEPEFSGLRNATLFLLLGLVFITIGAEYMVRGAQIAAYLIGVPESVIALSIIAFGTSLPELATCITAAAKKQSELIIGNILGSNVFNILLILGVTALVKPIGADAISDQMIKLDIWFMLGISLIFAALLIFRRKIGYTLGLGFFIAYLCYIVTIYALYLGNTLEKAAGMG